MRRGPLSGSPHASAQRGSALRTLGMSTPCACRRETWLAWPSGQPVTPGVAATV